MASSSFLEKMPLEVLDNVLSNFTHFDPSIDSELGQLGMNSTGSAKKVLHPYYTLSATCRTLHNAVEAHAKHLLLTRKISVTARTIYRAKYIKWVRQYCYFCAKKTSRKAIMDKRITCCRACDKTSFPPKMTMTEAINKFHLSKIDLFLPNPVFQHAKPLEMGKYEVMGVPTTMFYEPQVRARAKEVFGEASEEEMKKKASARRRLLGQTKLELVGGRWVHLDKDGNRFGCKSFACAFCLNSSHIFKFRKGEGRA